jgi:cytidine deaminase
LTVLPRALRIRLDQSAVDALHRAYAPYSRFRVGAAVLDESGRIHTAGNVENASYPVGLCAERAAIAVAIAAGARRFLAVSIATDREEPIAPCGMCRQALSEHAGNIPIRLVTREGRSRVLQLARLLPVAFGPESLGRRRAAARSR